jgi:hypothetical protein
VLFWVVASSDPVEDHNLINRLVLLVTIRHNYEKLK